MKTNYKFYIIPILLAFWSTTKGQDSISSFQPEFPIDRYSITVENGDTIYSLIPEIWDLNPNTTQPANAAKKASTKANKVSAYAGSYMDLSHIPESYAVDKSKDIGEIPIIQNSSNGALGYSIPIDVYQAANGMNPSIQINYNSMSRNGIAGYGWTIGGVSSISVVNSSYYYDGKPSPVKADATGAYMLDGQRLINLNTGNSQVIYYQTEQGNIKVTAYLAGTIIKYFNVYYPNGSVATYGYEDNASLKNVYPQTKAKDISGNIINYSYIETNNVYYVTDIIYGGREGTTPLSNHANISFEYEIRNDITPIYQGGVKVQQDSRLKQIKTYFNGQLLRTYSLTYNNLVSSILTQIDCSAGVKSLNPLKFYYGVNNQLTGFVKNDVILTSYFSNASAPDLILNKGKFDTYSTSDGLISYPNCETYYPIQIKTFLGFTTGIKFGSTYAANQSLLIYADLSSGISIPATLTAESGFQMLNAMDVDGDGNDELVKMNSAEVSSTAERVTYKVYDVLDYFGGVFIDERYSFDVNYGGVLQWDGLNSPADRKILTGDFLGNGKQSVLTITYNKNKRDVAVQSWATLVDFDNKTKSSIYDKACFSLNPYDLVFTMDFDGDRKTDICRKIGNTVELYSFDINSGELILIATDATINHPNDAEMLIGDINGDEKTDILVSPVEGHLVYGRCEYCLYCLLGIGSHCTNVVPTYQSGGNTWTVYFSKGTSAGFESQTITSAENGLNTSFMLQDMNGDDIPDLVANINGSLKLYPSVNGKLGEIPDLHTVDLIGGAQAFLIPGNADSGDKMSQFFSIYNYELNTITFDRSIAAEQLLTGTVSSEGIVSKIQYSRNLNDYNFYNRGTACSYPYQKLSGNLYLHASTESFLSGNRTSAINKNYTRGMIDLRGKGFLGFEQIQTYDEIRNKTSTQGYNPSGFGLLTSVDNSALSASFIYNISVATNKIAKVTLSSKSETDKLSNVTVNSTYAYDSYGNATSETKSYGNGITITKNNLYNNYTGTTYKLGELYQQTLTNLRNGQTYIEKTYIPVFDSYSKQPVVVVNYKNGNQTSDFINTYENGKISKESRKDFTANARIETSYLYDEFGRLRKKTNPLGLFEDYGYDNYGRLETITNHKNHITTFGYDDWGRKISTISPDGITQTINLQWIGVGEGAGGGSGSSGGTGDEYNKDIQFSAPMSTGITIAASNSIRLSTGYSFSAETGGNLKLWIDKTVSVSPPNISGGSSNAESEYMHLVTNRTTGAPATQSYIDALGREVRSGSMRFDGNYLYADKEYDSYGRLSRISLPFKGSLPSLWNTYTYDDYDRPLSITYASGKTDNFSYSGLSATSTIDGITKTITKDATGKVVNVVDPAGTITYNIRPDGQPSSIVAPGNITTTFEYDDYGRQKKLIDPSAGTRTYTYDDAQSIISETDDRGKITKTTSDKYNRVMQKEIVGELTTNYTYNSDGQIDTIRSNNSTAKIFTYDGLMRLSTVKDKVPDGKYLQKDFSYSAGIPLAVSFSTQNGTFATENYSYTYGTKTEIKLNNSSSVWKLTSENDMGLATGAITGNLTRDYGYDMYGLPTLRVVKSGASTIQDFETNFNPVTGNLNWRKDNTRSLQEDFVCDNLNRLTNYGGNIVSYNMKGNITNHTAVGSYDYGITAKPYMLTSVTPCGTAIPLRSQDISYNGMLRPSSISENGYTATFAYDESGQRVKMQLSYNEQMQLTRYYLGGQYELDTETGTERLYLGGDAYSSASVYVKEAGTWKIYYICRDNQGSITHVINADGSLKQELSYDPWGQLRNPATQQIYAVGNEPALFLTRGYTGHEHLSQFGLINMNARLYDVALGRFLSPDVYIQAADNSQNFNRYSYCLNNPLKYTDPSGNSFKSWYLGWLYNTNSGYEFQKTFSKTALHFHSGGGSDVSMSGYEISNGDWKVFGGERTYNGEITYKSYYDKSFSGKMYYDGIEDVGFMHSYYLNNYHSGDISQSTNIMTIGGPFINIKFEDNNIASKAHPNLVAPGGDDYRSSALEINFGPFNMGFKIMDGKAIGLKEKDANGNVFKNESDVHRVGIFYVGYGSFKIGYNSEVNIRAGIQNTWHKLFNKGALWDIRSDLYPDRFYWYIGSTGGSMLWY